MGKVFIEETTLTSIGDAIRGKTGETALLNPLDMPTAIESIETGGGGGTDLPEEAFIVTGDCGYRFANGGWDWFIEEYGDKITTENISNAERMFYESEIIELPFELNFIDGGCVCSNLFQYCETIETIPSIDFKQTSYKSSSYMFRDCESLKQIGTLKNLYPNAMNYFFGRCCNLRQLPEFENLNLNRIYTYASCNMSSVFEYCRSLRSIPEDLLKQFYQPKLTAYYNSVLNSGFSNCNALDEIRGLNPQTGTVTGNLFSSTFSQCNRLKDIIFATQDDGTPYSVNWKSQTINLSSYLGYACFSSDILNYNSGITADKIVVNDATYQALKNDPDWFTASVNYSRYNHDSAVNTINSLPDTSAYLATAGGTNTIKFLGAAGANTDGGAINTLTEEEIAVATAKGWTVTFG